MSILLKLIYRFNIIPIFISSNFTVETDKLTLKFTWKLKEFTMSKTILGKKNEPSWRIISLANLLQSYRNQGWRCSSVTVCLASTRPWV
jgi:hypothetical protein